MGIRVGVAGVGRLGREHVRVLGGLDGVSFVGCHDARGERARDAASAFGAEAFDSLEKLVDAVDALCVVVPTSRHVDVALDAIARGRHVFVEKPIAPSPPEARSIIDAARTAGVVLQVGHVERFNGALEAVRSRIGDPDFIEIHRLAPFRLRGTDVSVVGDLMIHDLDLLCHLLGEMPVEIHAAGAAILTPAPDIVNARLRYAGGCVANVTASRVTLTPMRKIRVFSQTGYVSIDLLNARATCYRKVAGFDERVAALRSAGGDEPAAVALQDFVDVETVHAPVGEEPLRKELEAFVHSVASGAPPAVSGEDGLRAVELATRILEHIGKGSGGGARLR